MSTKNLSGALAADADRPVSHGSADRLSGEGARGPHGRESLERLLHHVSRRLAVDPMPSAEALSADVLARRVAEIRAVLRGLVEDRAVLEHRIAALERAMAERWDAIPEPLPQGPSLANEERLFVRLRRTVPLPVRKAIVEAYRRWSR